MTKAAALFSVSFLLAAVLGACARAGSAAGPDPAAGMTAPPPTMEEGRQVMTIVARGGYSPYDSTAGAGIPGILRLQTRNTYDCSRALLIPSLGVQRILPASGSADFAFPAMEAGSELRGICSMGMYSFRITMR